MTFCPQTGAYLAAPDKPIRRVARIVVYADGEVYTTTGPARMHPQGFAVWCSSTITPMVVETEEGVWVAPQGAMK